MNPPFFFLLLPGGMNPGSAEEEEKRKGGRMDLPLSSLSGSGEWGKVQYPLTKEENK